LIHARSILWSSRCVVILSPHLALGLARLNATAATGLTFSLRGSHEAIFALQSPNATIYVDGTAAITSPIFTSLPSDGHMICDLRFFNDRKARAFDPWNIKMFSGFLITHRQDHILWNELARDHEFFCTPLTSDEMRWDPSIQLIMKKWKLAITNGIDLTTYKNIVICSTEEDASVILKFFGTHIDKSIVVLDCSNTTHLDKLIALILDAKTDASRDTCIVDALIGFDWLRTLLDEMVNASDGFFRVSELASFISHERQQKPKFFPQLKPAGREIFWEIKARSQLTRLK
jgi:hypothetical protein